jgi:hypothetical protein
MRAAETAYLDRDPDLPSAASAWRAGVAGALAGALLTAVALAGRPLGQELARVASSFGSAATRQEAASPPEQWRRRPLPREWRWSPPRVDVDHMFRKPR